MKRINKDIIKDYLIVFIGVLITAVSYNMFFLPYNLVVYDVGGISILYEQFLNLNPRIFVYVGQILCLIIGFIFLGFKDTKRAIFGSLLYPPLVLLTQDFCAIFTFPDAEPLVMAVVAGVTCGFGNGLIFKRGFNSGGTDIIELMATKYLKIPFSKSMLLIDGLIVICGGIVYGLNVLIYALIALSLIALFSDKLLLGINENKTFYVISDKNEDIKEYLEKLLSQELTFLKTKGAYTNDRNDMIMCVAPTRDYFRIKEGILEIDKNAFITITNVNEVID